MTHSTCTSIPVQSPVSRRSYIEVNSIAYTGQLEFSLTMLQIPGDRGCSAERSYQKFRGPKFRKAISAILLDAFPAPLSVAIHPTEGIAKQRNVKTERR